MRVAETTHTSALLERFERRCGAAVCVLDGDGAHTGERIVTGARSVAAALLGGRSSLEQRRVALLVEPGAAFVQALFGAMLAGGCAVVLSPLQAAPELRFVSEDADVEAILTSRALASRAEDAAAGRPVLIVERAREGPRVALVPVASASDAIQMYTSGTTGKPKGAVHTHASLAVQQRLLAETWGFGPGDVLLHALPLHHTHGLTIALLTAIGAGSALRMLPRFEAGAVWDAMAASSAFMAVPTMYAKLFAAYEAAGAATRARFAAAARGLRLATSGSAALPVALGERWRALAGTYPLERFGMTEIGVGASNPLGGERRPGTVGRVLPTFEARVVDDELWLAGPSLFSGYWRREQASAAAFVVDQGRRWLRTGDTVAFDPDGYLRILGRTSVDIIKSAGFKLSALEIEGALAEWGAAAEVAVVGAADETLGERVVACVVPSPGREQDCTLGALRAFAHDRLAAYKVPRELRLFATLPRNAMGKVVKPELARILRDGRAPQSG